MKGNYLGEFEEIVLLIVAQLGENAYGVPVTEEIINQTGRKARINAVHETLNRLEEKGLLNSHMGGATDERGGRRKRFYQVTPLGSRILHEVSDLRQQLWQRIPDNKLKWKPG
jgi:PadR family transcriptional regulator, regulatory protein PadR